MKKQRGKNGNFDALEHLRTAMPAFEARMKARTEAKIKFVPRTDEEARKFREESEKRKHAGTITDYLNDSHATRRCQTP